MKKTFGALAIAVALISGAGAASAAHVDTNAFDWQTAFESVE